MKLKSDNSFPTYIFIWTVFLASLYFYFPFTAEDAYIVGRYAYNFGTYGQLAYNVEDAISALTSPLQAILEGLLFSIFKYDPVKMWKLLGILLLITTVGTLTKLLTIHTQKIFFLIAVLFSSSILLWTIGGLETPLLMFLVSLTTFIFLQENIQESRTLAKLGFLSGVIFVTRFDASVFLLPISLHIVWTNKSSLKNLLFFILLAIVPIAVWFTFSKFYYGHYMPTSFFEKNPTLSVMNFIATMRGLFWTTVIPVTSYIFVAKKKKNTFLQKEICVFISLLSVVLYMFTMASVHMMFSFRPFVPYLPIFFVLLTLKMNEGISQVIIGSLIIFQVSLLYITYEYGINYPLSKLIEKKIVPTRFQKYFFTEFSHVNIPSYIEFMEMLENQGDLIAQDWAQNNSTKKAIVYTYAEGIASYTAQNLFFSGKLVTKGACPPPDYVMGLHWLDSKRNLGGIHSQNAFISNILNFNIYHLDQQVEFSVSRLKDLDKNNRKAISELITSCNQEKVW